MSKKGNSRKRSEISIEWLNQVRGEILPYTESSLYEYGHFLNVERHIKNLARARHLDENKALFIAYLHDVSRIKENVYGKRHSRRSAEIARVLLKDKKRDQKTQKIICNAIKRHNQKSKIHNVYDELIKDADSLAHQDEFGLNMENDFEVTRVGLIHLPEIYFTVNQSQEIGFIYEQYSSYLIKLLKTSPSDINHWVHEVRTSIRKLYAMLYFSENTKLKKEMLLILKDIFKVFAKSRAIYVIYKAIECHEPLESVRNRILIALNEENSKCRAYTQLHFTPDYVKLLEEQLKHNGQYLCFRDSQFLKLVEQYINGLKTSEINDIKSLHHLRIEGKRLKYILGSELIKMTHPAFHDTLLILHDLLGEINDLYEQNKYFRHYEMTSEERLFLDMKSKVKMKSLKKEIKARVFLLKKMVEMNKIIL